MLWTLLFLTVPVFGVVSFWLCAVYGAWLPENVSTIGGPIDNLFYIILGITGFFFVATEGLLVYAMFTAKGANGGKATFAHGNRNLEIGWTLMTAAILLFVAFYQIPLWAEAKMEKPNKPADCVVSASMWMWQVRYPAWDEAKGAPKTIDPLNINLADTFELSNEVHAIANEPTLLYLTSRDVLHSFYIPKMRVKQDAVPGLMIPVWFTANKTGDYEFYCAELCGPMHYNMRAKVHVHEDKAAYHKWLQEQSRARFAAKP
jgi:cytochrome c oxidase subunit 2